MNVFKGFEHKFEQAVVAVGSFDGVHKGHRLLIEKMNEKAVSIGGQAVVVTFDPHPRKVLRGQNRLLSTIDERLFLLEQAGAQNVVIINFTKEFAETSPEDFVKSIIEIGAQAVFIGEGHSFGRDKGGDEKFLANYPIQVCHIDRFENISSTEIRAAIESGNMERAKHLLKSDYMIFTPVTDATKLLPAGGRYKCEMDSIEVTLTIDEIKFIRSRHKVSIKSRENFAQSQ